MKCLNSGNMHSCREGVIGRLRAVYIIIRMNNFIAACIMQLLCSNVGNYFIDIHIGLCAGPGLIYNQREFVIPFALYDFIAGFLNSIFLETINLPHVKINFYTGLLKNS